MVIYGGTIGNVYGGGNKAPSNAGILTITSGSVNTYEFHIGNVYGGANQADITGDIDLYISASYIDNIFGGNNTSGTIDGTITVSLESDDFCPMKVGNVYGGGNKAAYDSQGEDCPVVNILNGHITGSVYGGGLGSTAVVTGNPVVLVGDESGSVIIGQSVFGGGDAAAVKGKPTVTIDECGTLIKTDVYGGGNAAPVYATEVVMNAGKVNGNMFGGGNGADLSKPGANVGYEPDNTTKASGNDTYGTTNVTVYGGTVGTWTNDTVCAAGTGGVFGGSNTQGDVWKSSNVNIGLIEKNNEECPIKVKDFYGAGNEAFMNGQANLNIGCYAPSMKTLFGGANKADVRNDIVLNILNGSFEKVFGGNNAGGKIYGSITVNIDETGCSPIKIGELYCCGNNAPYDVNWGKFDSATGKGDGTRNNDPVLNIISCDSIGKVFGGGYGEAAVVTGNPTVNISMVVGEESTELGTIGTVFGGGNAAKVIGESTVNIGTLSKVTRVATEDNALNGKTEDVVGVNITGNVYGGGNQAEVTGSTSVTIGR